MDEIPSSAGADPGSKDPVHGNGPEADESGTGNPSRPLDGGTTLEAGPTAGIPPSAPDRPSTDAPVAQDARTKPQTDPPGSLRTTLQAVGTVIAPFTLLTALAFYFGWVSTDATFSYFGLDASVLGLTVQEVVLSSTDALFVPLGAIVVVALAGLAAHAVMIRWTDAAGRFRQRVERISLVLAGLGAILFVLGVWAVMAPLPFRTPFLLKELSPGLGVASIAYAFFIRRRVRPATRRASSREAGRLWSGAMSLVWLLIALSLFWTVSEYAKALGVGRAQELLARLDRQPSAVVYAERDLHVEGPGVVKERLRGRESAFRYRYSGLTFLVRTGGKHFLLPDGWSRERGGVVVLPDEEGMRVEFFVGEE